MEGVASRRSAYDDRQFRMHVVLLARVSDGGHFGVTNWAPALLSQQDALLAKMPALVDAVVERHRTCGNDYLIEVDRMQQLTVSATCERVSVYHHDAASRLALNEVKCSVEYARQLQAKPAGRTIVVVAAVTPSRIARSAEDLQDLLDECRLSANDVFVLDCVGEWSSLGAMNKTKLDDIMTTSWSTSSQHSTYTGRWWNMVHTGNVIQNLRLGHSARSIMSTPINHCASRTNESARAHSDEQLEKLPFGGVLMGAVREAESCGMRFIFASRESPTRMPPEEQHGRIVDVVAGEALDDVSEKDLAHRLARGSCATQLAFGEALVRPSPQMPPDKVSRVTL